jgi:DNA-directed RNA polymerase subunit RPC12/RpoP
MVVTIHVAAVAYVFRSLARPSTLRDTMVWVPATIAVAVFLSWPIGRVISRAFDPGESGVDRTCPRCGRREIRPLIRPGAGLFQPVMGYRCAACWTTFRGDAVSGLEAQPPTETGPIDPSGIDFLSDPLGEDAIRFLDDPPAEA